MKHAAQRHVERPLRRGDQPRPRRRQAWQKNRTVPQYLRSEPAQSGRLTALPHTEQVMRRTHERGDEAQLARHSECEEARVLLLEGGRGEDGEQHGRMHDGGGARVVELEAHEARKVARPQARRSAHLHAAVHVVLPLAGKRAHLSAGIQADQLTMTKLAGTGGL